MKELNENIQVCIGWYHRHASAVHPSQYIYHTHNQCIKSLRGVKMSEMDFPAITCYSFPRPVTVDIK